MVQNLKRDRATGWKAFWAALLVIVLAGAPVTSASAYSQATLSGTQTFNVLYYYYTARYLQESSSAMAQTVYQGDGGGVISLGMRYQSNDQQFARIEDPPSGSYGYFLTPGGSRYLPRGTFYMNISVSGTHGAPPNNTYWEANFRWNA